MYPAKVFNDQRVPRPRHAGRKTNKSKLMKEDHILRNLGGTEVYANGVGWRSRVDLPWPGRPRRSELLGHRPASQLPR
eukprot:5602295-Pyramimonas_sp.AAC.1